MLDTILEEIQRRIQGKAHFCIAIDGRCASGKSTLGKQVQEALGCNLFHMDDFFLRPEQRTAKRYAEAGGNVDRERFLAEVLLPLQSAKPFAYQKFDCRSMALQEPTKLVPHPISIIEGVYSCHPDLWDFYDLRVFLTVNPETQLKRLQKRNPDKLDKFRQEWIPMEERYFAAYAIEGRADLCLDSSQCF